MTIENAVYRQVAIRWDAVTLPLKAGTPVSEAGTVANDGSAVGIVTQTVAVRPPVDGILVLVGGDVSRAEAEALYGAALSDDAVEAMSGIRFFGEHGTPWAKPEPVPPVPPVLTVTVTTADGTDTMDKTAGEILGAMQAGRVVQVLANGIDMADPADNATCTVTPVSAVAYDESTGYAVTAGETAYTAATLTDYPAYTAPADET